MKPEDNIYQQFFKLSEEILEGYGGRQFVGWFLIDIHTGKYVNNADGHPWMALNDERAIKMANAMAQQMIDEAERVLLYEN